MWYDTLIKLMGGIIIRKVELRMNEQEKYEIIKKLVDVNRNKLRAAQKLNLSIRQVNRLIKGYKEEGKAFFIHGNRGRQPVNTVPDDVKRMVIDLYTTKYYDANFTHYTKLLARLEGIELSVSTVTTILESQYILSPRVTKSKKKRIKKKIKPEKRTGYYTKRKKQNTNQPGSCGGCALQTSKMRLFRRIAPNGRFPSPVVRGRKIHPSHRRRRCNQHSGGSMVRQRRNFKWLLPCVS